MNTTQAWDKTGTAYTFYNADDVTFDDTATNTLVDMQNVIYPASVTVDGTSNYTFTTSNTVPGRISGTVGLTKNGSGTLTIINSNDYTGDTAINNGVLKFGSATAVTGYTANNKFIINGGTLELNSIGIGPVNVQISGAGYNGQGTIVSTGPTENYRAVHQLTLTGDATIGGSTRWDIGRLAGSTVTGGGFTLTKTGTNRIIIVDVGETGLGNIVVNQGDLCFQGTSTMGDTGKTATVNSKRRLVNMGDYDERP